MVLRVSAFRSFICTCIQTECMFTGVKSVRSALLVKVQYMCTCTESQMSGTQVVHKFTSWLESQCGVFGQETFKTV